MQRVIDLTTEMVNGVGPDQFANASPCEGWSVRDVVNHITGGATMFAMSFEQGSVPDDQIGQLMAGDNLGDDPKGAWQVAAKRAMAAFGEPGALDKTVTLPFGQMPASVALNIAIFDVLTHAADIATSTGQQLGDDELVEAALATGRQMIGPELRIPGVFGEEQPAPSGASPTERLLAFAGRKV
jgi:uncharacterized protein (TIGR03086 family)